MRPLADERTDAELLAATRDGEDDAFGVFYRRHREVVLGFCGQRAGDPEAAADLMAETFADALVATHDHERDLPNTPIAWLFAIAHRNLIDSYRRGRVRDETRRRLGQEPLVLFDADIERIEEITRSTEVALTLARELPPEQFAALQERVLNERSYADVARELRCSESVARKRVSRALNALRTSIGDPT